MIGPIDAIVGFEESILFATFSIPWFFERKIPPMPLVSGILITFFGGLTI